MYSIPRQFLYKQFLNPFRHLSTNYLHGHFILKSFINDFPINFSYFYFGTFTTCSNVKSEALLFPSGSDV